MESLLVERIRGQNNWYIRKWSWYFIPDGFFYTEVQNLHKIHYGLMD